MGSVEDPPPPSCDALIPRLTQRVSEIAAQEPPGWGTYLADHVPPISTSRAACDRWTPRYRRCLDSARLREDFFVCDGWRQRNAGADMEGPVCDDVLSHALRVVDPPADGAYVLKVQQLYRDGCFAMSRQVKECILRATNVAQLLACRR